MLNFDRAQLFLIRMALDRLDEEFDAHERNLRNVAHHLRAGESVPLFADGEPGAQAADGSADNLANDRTRIAGIQARIEQALEEVGP